MFENERVSPFKGGWGHDWPGHFLPTDKVGHWSTREGTPAGSNSMNFSSIAPKLLKVSYSIPGHCSNLCMGPILCSMWTLWVVSLPLPETLQPHLESNVHAALQVLSLCMVHRGDTMVTHDCNLCPSCKPLKGICMALTMTCFSHCATQIT